MLIYLDKHSGKPVFRQISDQVSQSIAGGGLVAGEKLASVRDLAKELQVNPMTVSKAYSNLEGEGLVERRKGIGIFVREREIAEAERIEPLRESLRQSARLVRRLDVKPDHALRLFADALEATKNESVSHD